MPQNLSDLPIQSKIKLGKHQIKTETPQEITWIYLQNDHLGYPAGSATLITEHIIDIRPLDANEIMDSFGNPHYDLSNIRQWLNSDASYGNWWQLTHENDSPPDSFNLPEPSAPYDQNAGFLYHFTDKEKELLMTTTISSQDQGAFEDEVLMNDKVFLPSGTEVGFPLADSGFMSNNWLISGFDNSPIRNSLLYSAKLTEQVLENSDSPSVVDSMRLLGLRSWVGRQGSVNRNVSQAIVNSPNGSIVQIFNVRPNQSAFDIRPIINIPQTTQVSDEPDADGYYSLYFPEPVPAPTNLTLLSDKVLFSYGLWEFEDLQNPNGTDYDYQCIHPQTGSIYEQETISSYNVNGKVRFVTKLGEMPDLATPDYPIEVKVRADIGGVKSEWASSGTILLNLNAGITYPNQNQDIGTISERPDFDLTVNIASNAITWDRTIFDSSGNLVDTIHNYSPVDVVTQSNSPTDLARITQKPFHFSYTNERWLSLPNYTQNTFTDRFVSTNLFATNTYNNAFVFTKQVDKLIVELTVPIPSGEDNKRPYRIRLDAKRQEALDTISKIYVANNGYDDEITWEDGSQLLKAGLSHVFQNTTKTDELWGVVFRIEMSSSEATRAQNILKVIDLNFEV